MLPLAIKLARRYGGSQQPFAVLNANAHDLLRLDGNRRLINHKFYRSDSRRTRRINAVPNTNQLLAIAAGKLDGTRLRG